MLVALLIPVEDCDCSFAFEVGVSILSVSLKGTRPLPLYPRVEPPIRGGWGRGFNIKVACSTYATSNCNSLVYRFMDSKVCDKDHNPTIVT